MSFSTHSRIRLASLLAVILAALMLAPSAFARGGHHSNWGISLGFSGPGYSIGFSDCRHCGRGYVSGSVYGGNSPSYYGGYSSPAYYGGYSSYSPGYYDNYYPSYGASYYGYSSYRPYRHHRNHRRGSSRHVAHYDNYYRDGRRDHRDHRRSRDNRSSRNDRRSRSHSYGDRDRGYSRRAAYYDRRN